MLCSQPLEVVLKVLRVCLRVCLRVLPLLAGAVLFAEAAIFSMLYGGCIRGLCTTRQVGQGDACTVRYTSVGLFVPLLWVFKWLVGTMLFYSEYLWNTGQKW